jgi:DNA-binding transcriptional ArsR family regulator
MAITLHLDGTDLIRVRFAISPIWETTVAARTLLDGRSRRYHPPWLAAVRSAAPRLDLAVLLALHPQRGYIPDFASPPPSTNAPTLESQLDELKQTPLERVRGELERCRANHPDASARALLRELAEAPEMARLRIAEAIHSLWEQVMAPLWRPVQSLLNRELANRSSMLARRGLFEVVETLHPRVHWSGDAIVLDVDADEERRLRGEGLVLMPSAFVWPSVTAIVDPPWQPTIVYPARGIASLWTVKAGPQHALASLIGRTRAVILADLEEPISTTALAKRHALSKSTISAHLTALRDAGIVASARQGHEVRYLRTPLGDRLLEG